MESEDLYPSDGSYFVPREPAEQIIERKHEQAMTLQGLDEIKKVIQHFEERIKYRDTLDSINVSQVLTPELHLRACIVNDMLKLALIEEKEMLEELVSIYAKNK